MRKRGKGTESKPRKAHAFRGFFFACVPMDRSKKFDLRHEALNHFGYPHLDAPMIEGPTWSRWQLPPGYLRGSWISPIPKDRARASSPSRSEATQDGL